MSMPKSKIQSLNGTYAWEKVGQTPMSIAEHDHFYHGPHCPLLLSEKGKCNGDCLEPCWAHGPNCHVGICLQCWLYGNNGGPSRGTIHHFMPTARYGIRKNKKDVRTRFIKRIEVEKPKQEKS